MYQTDFLPDGSLGINYLLIPKNEFLNNSYFRLDNYTQESNFNETYNNPLSSFPYYFLVTEGVINETLSNILIQSDEKLVPGLEYNIEDFLSLDFINTLKNNINSHLYIIRN